MSSASLAFIHSRLPARVKLPQQPDLSQCFVLYRVASGLGFSLCLAIAGKLRLA